MTRVRKLAEHQRHLWLLRHLPEWPPRSTAREQLAVMKYTSLGYGGE